MFQTASTFCLPGNALRSTLCVTTASGWALPPSTVATFLSPMKYSQLLVRWRAVITQVKVTLLPTVLAGQLRLSSASAEKPATSPLQDLLPLGASTLCGSNWIAPQSATAPDAQRACRLGGAET